MPGGCRCQCPQVFLALYQSTAERRCVQPFATSGEDTSEAAHPDTATYQDLIQCESIQHHATWDCKQPWSKPLFSAFAYTGICVLRAPAGWVEQCDESKPFISNFICSACCDYLYWCIYSLGCIPRPHNRLRLPLESPVAVEVIYAQCSTIATQQSLLLEPLPRIQHWLQGSVGQQLASMPLLMQVTPTFAHLPLINETFCKL
jgi:hypothetical protein